MNGSWDWGTQLVRRWADGIVRLVAVLGALATVSGYLNSVFNWAQSGPLRWLAENRQTLWLWALTFLVGYLVVRTLILHHRLEGGFHDTFAGDLGNWDFKGPWRIAEKGTLLVSGRDAEGREVEGIGLTRLGVDWENYTLTFRARIGDTCLGVIVRASDFNNLTMLQIRKDKVRPHNRALVPLLPQPVSVVSPQVEKSPDTLTVQPLNFADAWQVLDAGVPLNRPLDDWFDVRVVVKGQSVALYINDELVWEHPSFLHVPAGKIGFRNWSDETGFVRNVRVTLQP